MATTMVPGRELLAPPHPTERISVNEPRVHARVPFRKSIRKIPSIRNTFTLAFVCVQIAIVMAAPVLVTQFTAGWAAGARVPALAAVWIAAFLLMGRSHCLLAILMHEAAHRLLFANRKANDLTGRWLLAYPTFVPFDAYRGAHLAHHRDEMGPEEPDLPLYRGYPITRASMRRKLVRDATGQTGLKLLKGIWSAARSGSKEARKVAFSMVGVQIVILLICILAGYWWLYPILWLAPYLTVWRVLNRLRAIAEHGGMERNRDTRATTHVIRQHPAARFWMVPYCTGWHLAHHVDPGIPFRKLPVLHEALTAAGYVSDPLVYDSYTQLWAELASRDAEAAEDSRIVQ